MYVEQFQVDLDCQVERLAPFGIQITAPQDRGDSIESVPVEVLRPLLLENRLVVLRGFRAIDEQASFSDICGKWGELLQWDFGSVFEVVEQVDPKNYLFTHGSVPYHWDGAFADQVPWLQFFQCRESSQQDVGGETIFCDTAALWQTLSTELQECWQSIQIEYATDKVAHYGGKIRAPLVDRHPQTGETVIRFAEPANATTVELNTPDLEVLGIEPETVPAFLEELINLIYDSRFVYSHRWQVGDFLIADNHVLLHGRTKYEQHQPRRLWRVHIL